MIWGRSKVAALAFVKNKVGLKVQGWKHKLLSFAGREVLIKAVANAIPIYPMFCFAFPKKTCRELDMLIADFWWGNNGEEGNKIHWKRWDYLTNSKREGGLGFRDFKDLNKALLAKTAWRLLQNPEEFWCKILKGKYFPNESFFEAKKGRQASWCWSSILKGRNFLVKNLGWKVGSRSSIRIWKDKWVPGLPGAVLSSLPDRIINADTRVQELIRGNSWDLSSIEHCISEAEKKEILKIQLCEGRSDDCVFWLPCRDGIYSVKSGYKVAKERSRRKQKRGPESSFQVPCEFWRRVWYLNIPDRIKHFLWRIIMGIVPTKEMLFKRKCSESPSCPICFNEVENIDHLLFFCSWAQGCWFGSNLGLKISKSDFNSTLHWLLENFDKNSRLDDRGKAAVAILCWNIWKGRCAWVFNGEKLDMERVICASQSLLNECFVDKYMYASVMSAGGGNRVGILQWLAPTLGVIKINTDEAFISALDTAGIGVICRNSNGDMVGGLGCKVVASSAFMAECLALKEGILAVNRLGFENSIIETDCEELFLLMTDKKKRVCDWQCSDLIQELLGLKRSASGLVFTLVRRQGNKAANYLAAIGAKGMCPKGWLVEASSPLKEILLADVSNLKGPNQILNDGLEKKKGIG